MKVGVGQSVSFLRKQRGLRRLFTSPMHATSKLYDELAPRVGDPELGIAGFHWYTFNRLADTVEWEHDNSPAIRAAS
jgi:methylenetetrahydrofolate reductase (NADPH)